VLVCIADNNGGAMSKKALVRRPSPRLADGLVTFLEREAVDAGLAVRQWEAYVEALRAAGWETIEVDPIDPCPDGVFVEDTMVVYGDVAVVSHPGHPSRRPEVEAAQASVASLGYSVNRISAPGTLDGGDILKVGRTIYAGRGGRTNAEAVRRLRSFLQPLGAWVVAVPVTKVLHLKSAVTALPDGTILGYTPVLDNPGLFPHYMGMPEESGSLHTPASVHFGTATEIREARARVLDAAYAAHPERFVNRPPIPPLLPEAAWINKPVPKEPAQIS
jgi:dimethylargininase